MGVYRFRRSSRDLFLAARESARRTSAESSTANDNVDSMPEPWMAAAQLGQFNVGLAAHA